MHAHTIRSDAWILTLDTSTGCITTLHDRMGDTSLVTDPGATPFLIETTDRTIRTFRAVSFRTTDNTIRTTYVTDHGITLHTSVTLEDDEVRFRFSLVNDGPLEVRTVEYPVISGLNPYQGQGVLAHSYATGLLVKDPAGRFNDTFPGLRHVPYPESFSGASMQFFCYHGPSSGFVMMAKDKDMHQKWLNVYHDNGRLVASHITGDEDLGQGKDLKMDYDVALKAFKGDWTDGAELYRTWAENQPFVPRKTVERPHATWLYQDVGLSTFGINAGHDRTLWLNRYHDDLQVPIFHILGPDWTNHPQAFRGVNPGGLDEWVPTRFNQDNLRVIREHGDYVAPFEFDFLVNPDRSDKDNIRANLQVFPKPVKSHDAYRFNMLCPATDYTRAFHVGRDVRMLKESGVDSVYYDISSNNLIKTCMSETHGHPKGGGHVLSHAYNRIYSDTKAALEQVAGQPVPLGAEMANEIHLKTLDYAQARAWAQPASTLETYPFRDMILAGEAEVIPMFSYVYHAYGLLRLDGWGKLVKEIGTLFYHTVAKTYLHGGLYEINHEYSPMEMIDGTENSEDEHYIGFRPRGYRYDSSRMSYIRQFAALRTGSGNPYLAYGEMMRPIPVENVMETYDWFHYNHTPEIESYEAKGTIRLPGIITSAYRRTDLGKRAYFVANATSKDHHVTLTIPGTKGKTVTVSRDFDPGHEPVVTTVPVSPEDNTTHPLDLPAHAVVMVEVI